MRLSEYPEEEWDGLLADMNEEEMVEAFEDAQCAPLSSAGKYWRVFDALEEEIALRCRSRSHP